MFSLHVVCPLLGTLRKPRFAGSFAAALLFVSATYKAFAAGCACASFKASGERIEGIPSQEIIQNRLDHSAFQGWNAPFGAQRIANQNRVIPDGEADPGSFAARAQGGPRSALRSGGDDSDFG
ncbi:hypothetical protein PbB2_00805 [Candidatus Phycosocius bacilliformis]|uniref:Uncharacterized protein n=1 Tax=Candidatus Phycosocius bacilliformis TaxID=1445552 RepID=A0A2P2E7V7_9PROT|nr:hypothetical protein [Candidatus Phycosocius bacilliformis]GBF57145.1 hypothetical protein PbB2_00805 [Candidatus Phycosocius bacilliformis]